MKKKLITLALAFASCFCAMAETVDEFINKMKNDTTVENVELTSDVLNAMIQQQMSQENLSQDGEGTKAMEILKKVSCIHVLDGSLPSGREAIDAFKARLAALTVDGLDEMVNTREKGELTRVWIQVDGNVCKSIIVVDADEAEHDWQVVRLDCNITMDENFDINDLIHFN